MERVRRIVVLLALPVLIGTVATTAQEYDMHRVTIDGGGEMFSTGGVFTLSGTVGQPDAGTLSGVDFTVTGGFWFPQVPADCNVDGGVNLFDYATFEACMTGPSRGLLDPSCVCFDLDGDGDVDLQDVGTFQRLFSG